MWPFSRKQKNETRASGPNFTAQVVAARESFISGRRGIVELSGAVQSCVSLWENGLSLADVSGTDLLTSDVLSMAARALATRGEAVFYLTDDRILAASDWDLTTRLSTPRAYRLSIPDVGGSSTLTALAGEVLHFKIGTDIAAPYAGQAPLRRAGLSADLLAAVEDSLKDVFEKAPIGSQIVSFPESTQTDNERLSRGFRGNRGAVLLKESTNVVAAGGPTPQTDWLPRDVTPDLQNAMLVETLNAARDNIYSVYGVLPGLNNPATTGPMVREAQRHLAQWTLQPIARAISRETSEKTGLPVEIDVMRPLQAFDAGGRARAFSTLIGALSEAKQNDLDPAQVTSLGRLIDWESI